jgi:hypothetical protein
MPAISNSTFEILDVEKTVGSGKFGEAGLLHCGQRTLETR